MEKTVTYAEKLMLLAEHDSLTYKHSLRVAEMCYLFGDYLGLNDKSKNELYELGLYHDIGKLYIDTSILVKDSKLNDAEYKQILNHTLHGERMLRKKGYSESFLMAIRGHHENYNGTGYPDRLVSKQINLYSSILRIIDSYDAMTNVRSYQKALSKEDALKEIKSLIGQWYHPLYANKFIQFMMVH